MTIRAYLLRRFAFVVFVLLGVSMTTFVIARVIPSDPAAIYAGPMARKEAVEEARKILRLDRPLWEQYLDYMGGLVRGDWGSSLRTKQPVLGDILEFAPVSLELILASMLFATVVGVVLGTITANKQGCLIDFVVRVFAVGGVSVPSFWIALMLQIVFFRKLGLLPPAGQFSADVIVNHPIQQITGMPLFDALVTGNIVAWSDGVKHFILPFLAMAAFPTGVAMRMTRSSMLESLGQDYIRSERAMGISKRVILYRYALKNSLAPVLTVLGLTLAYSLIGMFFIELVFAYPGLGSYGMGSILSLDYPAIMGVTLFVAFVYVMANLAVDLGIAALDPRVTLS
jgi:ABC-type dipeptide/oligopeptide/nickel transport system permease component